MLKIIVYDYLFIVLLWFWTTIVDTVDHCKDDLTLSVILHHTPPSPPPKWFLVRSHPEGTFLLLIIVVSFYQARKKLIECGYFNLKVQKEFANMKTCVSRPFIKRYDFPVVRNPNLVNIFWWNMYTDVFMNKIMHFSFIHMCVWNILNISSERIYIKKKQSEGNKY